MRYANVINKRVYDMSDMELAIYKKIKARRAALKKNIIRLTGVLVLIVVFSLAYKGITSKAIDEKNAGKCKFYKTVSVEFDKTIKDIAEENFDSDYYENADEYLSEIMKINHLSKDSAIVGGQIIFIPYYSDIH